MGSPALFGKLKRDFCTICQKRFGKNHNEYRHAPFKLVLDGVSEVVPAVVPVPVDSREHDGVTEASPKATTVTMEEYHFAGRAEEVVCCPRGCTNVFSYRNDLKMHMRDVHPQIGRVWSVLPV